LQWLDPSLTEGIRQIRQIKKKKIVKTKYKYVNKKKTLNLGKKHPYLFSQFQAIHARSCIPCQDSPFVKQTYFATLVVPKPLISLMSAPDVTGKTNNKVSSE
jgi:aminopeptidase N